MPATNLLPGKTPFIFEEPKPSYYLLDHAGRQLLLSLGPLSLERLIHIERVHVVSQSLSHTQVTVARHLDLPHYQATTKQVHNMVFSRVSFYRDDNTSNDFIYVGSVHNYGVDVLLRTIDIEAIGTRLLSKRPTESIRQSYF